MQSVFRLCAAFLALVSMASAAPGTPQTDDLMDRLGMPQLVAIMRTEGLAYAQELADDMLPSGNTSSWEQTVGRIYDERAMQQVVRARFADALAHADVATMARYIGSQDAQRVVALEISAREAMLDRDIENEAKQIARRQKLAGDDLYHLITDMVDLGDLLEANIASGMNSNIMFYRGLVDGGAFAMSDDEILADVQSQQGEIRADTEDWLYGFLTLAYNPLEHEDLRAYIDFMASDAGKSMMRAVFEAYDGMYADISYALGLAVAREMAAQDI